MYIWTLLNIFCFVFGAVFLSVDRWKSSALFFMHLSFGFGFGSTRLGCVLLSMCVREFVYVFVTSGAFFSNPSRFCERSVDQSHSFIVLIRWLFCCFSRRCCCFVLRKVLKRWNYFYLFLFELVRLNNRRKISSSLIAFQCCS